MKGKRFLGALQGTESQLDEVLCWLDQGGEARRRAVFFDNRTLLLDRAFFFTWLASEWAYFKPIRQDRNFWPRLWTEVLSESPDPPQNEIYELLRVGLNGLGLANHLGDPRTGWTYIESLRRQSGFPRAWWDWIHEVCQETARSIDRGHWGAYFRECGMALPRGLEHAARKFPSETNAFFDAAVSCVRSRTPGPLRSISGGFAREPEALAGFLAGRDQLWSFIRRRRDVTAARRRARRQRAEARFWVDSVEIGVAAVLQRGVWICGAAAYLPRSIPAGFLPGRLTGAGRMALHVRGDGGGDVREGVLYRLLDDEYRADGEPFIIFSGDLGRNRLVARAEMADGGRSECALATVESPLGSPEALFYQPRPDRPGFFSSITTLPGESRLGVPEGERLLVVAKPDEAEFDNPPEAVIPFGDRAVHVLPPVMGRYGVMVGESFWEVFPQASPPGLLAVEGPVMLPVIGRRIYSEWPTIRWRGNEKVRIENLRVVPRTDSNARLTRTLAEPNLTLEPGEGLQLAEAQFRIGDDVEGHLPRAFVGKAVVAVQLACGDRSWTVREQFTIVPPTEFCPGKIESDGLWQVPIRVFVTGVESVKVRPRWELTAGGAPEEEEWRHATSRDGEVSLKMQVPVQGARLLCDMRFGFRSDLPDDLAPGFTAPLECEVPGVHGFLLEGARTPKAIRPLGEDTEIQFADLASTFLVLRCGDPRSDDETASLTIDGKRALRLQLSSDPQSLADIRRAADEALDRWPRVEVRLQLPDSPLQTLFVVRKDRAVEATTVSPPPRNETPQKQAEPETPSAKGTRVSPALIENWTPLANLAANEALLADPSDDFLRAAARALLEELVSPRERHWGPRCWALAARIRLVDFGGWEPSGNLLEALDEPRTSQTRIALPWLWKAWAIDDDRAESDSQKYQRIGRLIPRLENLGRRRRFAFLPALIAGALDHGPAGVASASRESTRYLLLMLTTGCRTSVQYQSCAASESVPKGRVVPPPVGTEAPWWVSKPADLRYAIAWEIARAGPSIGKGLCGTLKKCHSVDLMAELEADNLMNKVVDLQERLHRKCHPARMIVWAALACSKEWARYVTGGIDLGDLLPLMPTFSASCDLAPVLTRSLCIDALLCQMEAQGVGVAQWAAFSNDGKKDLDAFPPLWKHLMVPEVV